MVRKSLHAYMIGSIFGQRAAPEHRWIVCEQYNTHYHKRYAGGDNVALLLLLLMSGNRTIERCAKRECFRFISARRDHR